MVACDVSHDRRIKTVYLGAERLHDLNEHSVISRCRNVHFYIMNFQEAAKTSQSCFLCQSFKVGHVMQGKMP